MKRFRPDYYCKSIFDIPISFYKKLNIKYIFSDLDNTLDKYDILIPSKRVMELKTKLLEAGIVLCITSNNRAERKDIYCKRLGVRGIFSCRKPGKKKILSFIEMLNIKKEEVIIVGDQILTDVGCGKSADIKVCLTDPITDKDQWTTKFNRLIDRPIRKHLRKKGILKEVEIKDE